MKIKHKGMDKIRGVIGIEKKISCWMWKVLLGWGVGGGTGGGGGPSSHDGVSSRLILLQLIRKMSSFKHPYKYIYKHTHTGIQTSQAGFLKPSLFI